MERNKMPQLEGILEAYPEARAVAETIRQIVNALHMDERCLQTDREDRRNWLLPRVALVTGTPLIQLRKLRLNALVTLWDNALPGYKAQWPNWFDHLHVLSCAIALKKPSRSPRTSSR